MKVYITHLVGNISHLEVIGDIMDFYGIKIEPEEIRFNENTLYLGGLSLKVESGRFAFAQALSHFDEPKMQFWFGNNAVCENTEFNGPVQIGYNNTIGKQGFGYEQGLRIRHLGKVWIGERVDIGSGVCIDRAVIGSTIIGNGCKIDNQVHIAHGVEIGENTLIVAGSVIGGSTKIGNNCFIGINASIKNKIRIGNNVTIGMGAIVLSDVPDNTTVKGLWK
jgi:acetyltransferase-like isoleucine patch superfamily enzyme